MELSDAVNTTRTPAPLFADLMVNSQGVLVNSNGTSRVCGGRRPPWPTHVPVRHVRYVGFEARVPADAGIAAPPHSRRSSAFRLDCAQEGQHIAAVDGEGHSAGLLVNWLSTEL